MATMVENPVGVNCGLALSPCSKGVRPYKPPPNLPLKQGDGQIELVLRSESRRGLLPLFQGEVGWG